MNTLTKNQAYKGLEMSKNQVNPLAGVILFSFGALFFSFGVVEFGKYIGGVIL